MRNPVYFNVAPRYSGGSPAQVDEATALRVVDDERHAYRRAIEGAYGSVAADEARAQGLRGIVEERTERADCWLVTDLLTGEKYVRMFHRDIADYGKWTRKTRRLATLYRLPVEGYNLPPEAKPVAPVPPVPLEYDGFRIVE